MTVFWLLNFSTAKSAVGYFISEPETRQDFLTRSRLASSGKDSTRIYFQGITHIRYMCYKFFCWSAAINESLFGLSDSPSLSAKQTKNYRHNTRKRALINNNLFSLISHSWKKFNGVKIPIEVEIHLRTGVTEMTWMSFLKFNCFWGKI